MAHDPLSHVAAWLIPASADVTDKPPSTSAAVDDPVLALIAEKKRLEALWIAATKRGDQIFVALPDNIRRGRVRVSFSKHDTLLQCPSGFTSEADLQEWVRVHRDWALVLVSCDVKKGRIGAEVLAAEEAEFNREIGLDQALAQLRAGLEEIKALREEHYREARDIEPRAQEIHDQLRQTKPVTLAGAIAMIELGLEGGDVDADLITAALAGLRDMQPEASSMSVAPEDEPGTAEALAAIEFEPVGPEVLKRFAGPAWRDECLKHGAALWLASVLAGKTKSELIDGLKAMVVEDGGMAAFEETTRVFQSTADLFDGFAELLRAAYMRQMVAVANLELEFDREAEESETKREVETASIGFGDPEGKL